MRTGKNVTALATVALLLAAAGPAYGDPYADEALSVVRASGPNGEDLTFEDAIKLQGEVIGTKDKGNEALGKPNLNDFGQRTRVTILGYDQTTGIGGQAVLGFRDNMCLASAPASAATDIRVFDQMGNQSAVGDESATVEVSNDGGESFVLLGEVGPGLGAGPNLNYELKAGNALPYFNVVRVTATDTDGFGGIEGMDLDAVQCLTSVEAPYFDYNLDRCDFSSDFAERDIESVLVRTNGTQIVVEMTLCGDLPDDPRGKATYTVNFDVDSPTVLEGNAACADTSDFAAVYKQNGGGTGADFVVSGNRITATLGYGNLTSGDQFLVWVTSTANGPAADSVPNVEAGDRCGEPQSVDEVLSVKAL